MITNMFLIKIIYMMWLDFECLHEILNIHVQLKTQNNYKNRFYLYYLIQIFVFWYLQQYVHTILKTIAADALLQDGVSLPLKLASGIFIFWKDKSFLRLLYCLYFHVK